MTSSASSNVRRSELQGGGGGQPSGGQYRVWTDKRGVHYLSWDNERWLSTKTQEWWIQIEITTRAGKQTKQWHNEGSDQAAKAVWAKVEKEFQEWKASQAEKARRG